MEQPRSFTADFSSFSSMLITTCGVSEAYALTQNARHPIIRQYNALWDTGAMKSSISRRVAEELGLVPLCRQKVLTASDNKGVFLDAYLVNFFLPNGAVIPYLHVTEAKLSHYYDLIVGMDIILRGDFSITHNGGRTKMSFQMPPTHDTDFVKENAGKE